MALVADLSGCPPAVFCRALICFLLLVLHLCDAGALQILPNTTDITTDSALVGASSVSASVESSLPTVTE